MSQSPLFAPTLVYFNVYSLGGCSLSVWTGTTLLFSIQFPSFLPVPFSGSIILLHYPAFCVLPFSLCPVVCTILLALPSFRPTVLRPKPWNPVNDILIGQHMNSPCCPDKWPLVLETAKVRFDWMLDRVEFTAFHTSHVAFTRKGWLWHVINHDHRAVNSSSYPPTIQYACLFFFCAQGTTRR